MCWFFSNNKHEWWWIWQRRNTRSNNSFSPHTSANRYLWLFWMFIKTFWYAPSWNKVSMKWYSLISLNDALQINVVCSSYKSRNLSGRHERFQIWNKTRGGSIYSPRYVIHWIFVILIFRDFKQMWSCKYYYLLAVYFILVQKKRCTVTE